LSVRRSSARATSVDCKDDALAAELGGGFMQQCGIANCGGIERNLIAAGSQQRANIFNTVHASADCKWNREFARNRANDFVRRFTALDRRGDIEKYELVGTGTFVQGRKLDGIARIAQLHEVHAFDDAPVFDIETRNNPSN
jgi:hypothetical protein